MSYTELQTQWYQMFDTVSKAFIIAVVLIVLLPIIVRIMKNVWAVFVAFMRVRIVRQLIGIALFAIPIVFIVIYNKLFLGK